MHKRWSLYVAGDPRLSSLIAWDWRNPPWQALIATRKAFPTQRLSLVEALLRQNTSLLQKDHVLHEAIKALRDPHTFTVTTGQQPGWLTGPFYTLIKAAHTLQLARRLNELFGGQYRFVPVFWIASEDHDAEEVRQVAISWQEVLRYEGRFSGAIGRHIIEAAFPAQVERLALQRYWQVGESWENAFRQAMQALFQGTGMVWLSPDDPQLKALAVPLWVREIQERVAYHAHALAVAQLAALGEAPCLHARPINLFWLLPTDRRYPFPEEREALLQAAYQEPHRLSPNVLLRPLYQEYLLPNIAYVAGPGEVAYWLELLPIFTAFDVPMPVLYPRGHVRVLAGEIPELPPELPLDCVWELSQGRLRNLLAELWGRSELEAVMTWWHEARPPVEKLEDRPFLQRQIRTFQHRWQAWGESLRKAIRRHAYQTHRSRIDAVLRFRSAVEPEGYLQERTLNIHAFAPTNPVEWFQTFLRRIQLHPARMHLYLPEDSLR